MCVSVYDSPYRLHRSVGRRCLYLWLCCWSLNCQDEASVTSVGRGQRPGKFCTVSVDTQEGRTHSRRVCRDGDHGYVAMSAGLKRGCLLEFSLTWRGTVFLRNRRIPSIRTRARAGLLRRAERCMLILAVRLVCSGWGCRPLTSASGQQETESKRQDLRCDLKLLFDSESAWNDSCSHIRQSHPGALGHSESLARRSLECLTVSCLPCWTSY